MAFNVMHLPLPDRPVTGWAYRSKRDDVCYINLYGTGPDHHLLFVLLHEIAHHIHHDTAWWTSEPTWSQEYRADIFALERIKPVVTDDQWMELDQMAREHVRAHLQYYIDHNIWNHVDPDVVAWAGCDMHEPPIIFIESDEECPF